MIVISPICLECKHFNSLDNDKLSCKPYADGIPKEIITSEQLGVKKPNPAIFQYAIEKAKASVNTSIMIGDDLQVDVLGAKEFGMSQIYFNPENIYHNEIVSYEINCLSELLEIL